MIYALDQNTIFVNIIKISLIASLSLRRLSSGRGICQQNPYEVRRSTYVLIERWQLRVGEGFGCQECHRIRISVLKRRQMFLECPLFIVSFQSKQC